MISPRATLITTAPGFIAAIAARLIKPSVSAVNWQQTATKSLSPSNACRRSEDSSRLTPSGAGSPAATRRRVPTTRIPTASHSRATSRPIPPRPTTQTVLPRSNLGR